MPKKVIVRLPKFGLGNMLLVWAKGLVFAKENKLKFYCIGWNRVHWGAIFRRETHSRFYGSYFSKYSVKKRLSIYVDLLLNRKVVNPTNQLNEDLKDVNIVFNSLITDTQMFKDLRPYQSEIKRSILEMLRPQLKNRFDKLEEIDIAVHIRRGDFRLSHLATSIDYFITVIEKIRLVNGYDTPVKIFTDGTKDELKQILSLDNVEILTAGEDILDILWMSKSKILILSPSSSFSYWAAFLSDAKVIIKETDWQLRIKEDNQHYQELRWPENTEHLEAEILSSLHLNEVKNSLNKV